MVGICIVIRLFAIALSTAAAADSIYLKSIDVAQPPSLPSISRILNSDAAVRPTKGICNTS